MNRPKKHTELLPFHERYQIPAYGIMALLLVLSFKSVRIRFEDTAGVTESIGVSYLIAYLVSLMAGFIYGKKALLPLALAALWVTLLGPMVFPPELTYTGAFVSLEWQFTMFDNIWEFLACGCCILMANSFRKAVNLRNMTSE